MAINKIFQDITGVDVEHWIIINVNIIGDKAYINMKGYHNEQCKIDNLQAVTHKDLELTLTTDSISANAMISHVESKIILELEWSGATIV